MSPATIAQLIIALGPSALALIPKLAALWEKPTLSPAEVEDICKVSDKTYAELKTEVKASLNR